MAEKRMYTKKVTNSDSFIEMSSSTQALYFHLSQEADDDGFNNQIQNAMFKAHASVDDLKVLMAKKFIIQFETGVIVIKHWRMHNTLRKDRYIPTSFQDEIKQLGLLENGTYEKLENIIEITDGNQMATKWQPNGNPDKNSLDKISLDKNRLDKLSIDKERIPKEREGIERVENYLFDLLQIEEKGKLLIENWVIRTFTDNQNIPVETIESFFMSLTMNDIIVGDLVESFSKMRMKVNQLISQEKGVSQ